MCERYPRGGLLVVSIRSFRFWLKRRINQLAEVVGPPLGGDCHQCGLTVDYELTIDDDRLWCLTCAKGRDSD